MDGRARPQLTVTLGIELDGALAPQGVASFVTSVQEDYYTAYDVSPSRSVRDCWLASVWLSRRNRSVGPDVQLWTDRECAGRRNLPRGTIAIARAGNDAYSNGRQFFIVFEESTLPADNAGGYTVIGRVTSGLDAPRL